MPSERSMNCYRWTGSTQGLATSRGTARSLLSASTSPRGMAESSRSGPSTRSSGALLGSAQVDTHKLCRCGRPFMPHLLGQSQCRRCRALQLMLDARYERPDKALLDAQIRAVLDDHTGDWQVVDETGRLVWASDLADRYRTETTPRPVRNNTVKWQ